MPLADHALPVVVHDHHFHGQVVLRERAKFLNVHQNTGIACDTHDPPIGTGHLGAECRRHAKSHRSQARTADPASGAIAQVLGSPHLMLPHIGGDDGIGRQISDRQKNLLGVDRSFSRRDRQGITLFPVLDPFEPGCGARFMSLLQAQFHQSSQTGPNVPEHCNIRSPVLADFSRVDLKMNHPSPGGEGVELAGHAIVETRSHSNEQVTVSDREIGVSGAVHTEHAQRQWVVFIKGPLPHECCGHGELIALRQHHQTVVSGSRDSPTTHIQQGTVGRLDQRKRVSNCREIRRWSGSETGRNHRARLNGLVVELLLSDILGDIDQHRTWTPRCSDMKGLGNHRGKIRRIANHPGMLHDRKGDSEDIGFLEGVGADRRSRDLPGDHNHRNRIHLRRRDAGDEIGGARS